MEHTPLAARAAALSCPRAAAALDPPGSSAPSEPAKRRREPLTVPGPEDSKPRILIVDDESELRTFSQFVLEPLGVHCDQAGNGLIALEAVRTTAYDLVLLDIDMPKMTGLEVLPLLRAECTSPNLNIIMRSGGSNRSVR